jgi:O-acetyl-ADP-ribose deacetylase (regulator of RNase III)
MNQLFIDGRVIVKVGDLTEEKTDAIVNAANSTLLGGGGVDGAIHARGGPSIIAECRLIRQSLYPDGLPTGKAVITTGGDLPAKHVIHTVGPIYGEHRGREAELLADCYQNCLRLAVENSLATVAFPSISCGIYSYPRSEAAVVSSTNIKAFLARDETITAVRLVFFSTPDAETFLEHQRF